MPRITKEDLQIENTALRRDVGALQEYVTLTVREKYSAREEITLDCGDVHVFELWGASRMSGGVLLHVHMVDGQQASAEVLYFSDAQARWSLARRAHFLHDDAWKIFDAIDRLGYEQRKILGLAA